jgi:hypothetical protein
MLAIKDYPIRAIDRLGCNKSLGSPVLRSGSNCSRLPL